MFVLKYYVDGDSGVFWSGKDFSFELFYAKLTNQFHGKKVTFHLFHKNMIVMTFTKWADEPEIQKNSAKEKEEKRVLTHEEIMSGYYAWKKSVEI